MLHFRQLTLGAMVSCSYPNLGLKRHRLGGAETQGAVPWDPTSPLSM